mgnify:CR=1 FL=1
MKIENFSKNRGFTLIEIIIYVSFLGFLMVWIIGAMIRSSTIYQAARAEREVVSNARLALERIQKTLAEADDIYTPTSRFNSVNGQLSVLISSSILAGHTGSYLDFWLNGGRLWLKEEGQNPQPVTSPSVKVSSFFLENIAQGLNKDAVKITLRVEYYTSLGAPVASTTLYSTTALRGAY